MGQEDKLSEMYRDWLEWYPDTEPPAAARLIFPPPEPDAEQDIKPTTPSYDLHK